MGTMTITPQSPAVSGLSISSKQIRSLRVVEELAVMPTTITIVAWSARDDIETGKEVEVTIGGHNYIGKVVEHSIRRVSIDDAGNEVFEHVYVIADEPYFWARESFEYEQEFSISGVGIGGFVNTLSQSLGASITGLSGVPANYLSIEFSGTKTGAIQYLSQLTGYLPVYYNKTNGGPKVVFVDADDIGSYTPSGVTVVGKGAAADATFSGIRVLGELNTYPRTPDQFEGEYSDFSKAITLTVSKEAWEISQLVLKKRTNTGTFYVPYYKITLEYMVWFYARIPEWIFIDPTGLSGSITVDNIEYTINFVTSEEDIELSDLDDTKTGEAFAIIGSQQRLDILFHGLLEFGTKERRYYATALAAKIRNTVSNAVININIGGSNYRIRWPYETKHGSSPYYEVVNNEVSVPSQAARYAKTLLWMMKGAKTYTLFNTIKRTGVASGITRSEVEWTPSTGLMCTVTTRG